jgi:formylglycine-generating enzyme required for sulfatase activity
VNDKDKRRGDDQQNFDLTTPNIPYPDKYRNPASSGQPPSAGPTDKTILNAPVRRTPQRQNPPASQQNKFDLTVTNFVGPYEEDEEPRPETMGAEQPAQQQPEPRPTTAPVPSTRPAQPRRGIPTWAWALGVTFALLVIAGAGLAIYFLLPGQAFTLRVLNAPPGSKVYIDDVPSGVPQRDGTITVQGLRPGEAREVRVSQEGFADWKTTVTGEPGKTLEITAKLTPLQVAKGLPTEIDYKGRMVLVPAGDFIMGSNSDNPDESPEHPVTVPDFYIDKYEVKNEEYARFCAATNHPHPVNPFWDSRYFESNPRMPVIGISYDDAAAYAAWAGKRLPNEGEWEKAASWGPDAKAKRRYPWGNSPEASRANVNSNHPSQAGQFAEGASAYGVQDMAGNAREWVDAMFTPYAGNSASGSRFDRNLRVVRGGDFRSGMPYARTTSRLGIDPGFKTNPGDDKLGKSSLVGFRCAISADDPRLQEQLKSSGR